MQVDRPLRCDQRMCQHSIVVTDQSEGGIKLRSLGLRSPQRVPNDGERLYRVRWVRCSCDKICMLLVRCWRLAGTTVKIAAAAAAAAAAADTPTSTFTLPAAIDGGRGGSGATAAAAGAAGRVRDEDTPAATPAGTGRRVGDASLPLTDAESGRPHAHMPPPSPPPPPPPPAWGGAGVAQQPAATAAAVRRALHMRAVRLGAGPYTGARGAQPAAAPPPSLSSLPSPSTITDGATATAAAVGVVTVNGRGATDAAAAVAGTGEPGSFPGGSNGSGGGSLAGVTDRPMPSISIRTQ
ncbi:hypothetical protein I4F81_009823 [Pyropia yezoensis]|uniref:Uncharacterized protein n=1 Tax=Pyropia yezoensis TaxID=2788 RepID=A0ACC3CAM5_PYRYE|nr:hypothetical protein I4F81_009823 [Neopyropia yezoensis]